MVGMDPPNLSKKKLHSNSLVIAQCFMKKIYNKIMENQSHFKIYLEIG